MWKRPDRQIWQGIGFALLLIWFWNENGAQPLVLLLTAAAVHEGAHLLVFRCFGVRPATFSLSPFGAVLEVDSRRLSYGAELAAVLAGPCANLVCGAVLCRAAAGGNTALFAAAGAHLVLGTFNLLPLRPLDGGRALQLAASCALGPAAGERLASAGGAAAGFAAAGGLVWLLTASGGNFWLLPAAVWLGVHALRELGNLPDPARFSRFRRSNPVFPRKKTCI